MKQKTNIWSCHCIESTKSTVMDEQGHKTWGKIHILKRPIRYITVKRADTHRTKQILGTQKMKTVKK